MARKLHPNTLGAVISADMHHRDRHAVFHTFSVELEPKIDRDIETGKRRKNRSSEMLVIHEPTEFSPLSHYLASNCLHR